MQSTVESIYHRFRRLICIGCGRQVDIPIYCGNRFCPICGKPRTLRIRRKLTNFLSTYKLPARHSFKMVTLSVQNCEDLYEGVDYLITSFRRLRQRSYWKSVVDGGAFVIEIKGSPKNWHPHIHAIVSSRYLNWDKLSRDWNRCSGGLSCYISNCKRGQIVNYMLKYITKPSVNEVLIPDVANALYSKRLFQPFGSFHSAIGKLPKVPYACPKCGADHLEPVGTYEPWHATITKECTYVQHNSNSPPDNLLL